MELVYLWVEDYKNIKKQGFNFSPRFHCKYNEEDNKLTITGNNDYIPDFFGKNINITAIVGKNGSGKSNILKFIRQIIDKQVHDGSFLIFYNKISNKYICIYTTIKINSNIKLEQNTIIDNHIIFPMFDYSLTYDNSINFQNEQQLPIYPKKINGEFSFFREIQINKKNIIQNYLYLKYKSLLNKFKGFFQPDKLLISIDISTLYPNTKEKLKEIEQQEYDIFLYKLNRSKSIFESLSLIQKIHELLSKEESYIQPKDEYDKLMNFDFNFSSNDILGDFHASQNTYPNIWDNLDIYNNIDLEILLSKNGIQHIKKEDENIYKIFEFNIDSLNQNDINNILGSFFSRHFQVEIIDVNNKRLNDLSFGEQQLIFILNQLYSLGIKNEIDLYNFIEPQEIVEQGHNLNTIERYTKIEYIVLLDEIDIGFHPDWQKRTIQYIIDFLSIIPDKNFHLIFTTHSPFLLSDIPKENIIFLNDESSIKQTFGANIHTLLSDSFFMEDGLMGEFAKGKIMQIQKFHKKVIKYQENEKVKKAYICFYNKKQKEFEQIQSIIGEPFLKTIVKNQLEEIETILFKDKAKQLAIQRFINEFGEDAINEVIKNGKA